jgi:hypothetical protein
MNAIFRLVAVNTNYETNLPKVGSGSGQVQDILQILFAVVGALAVLMLVIAGFRFITAQGNSQEVSKAKATIVYALIGLVIVMVAQAIVSFTLGKLD